MNNADCVSDIGWITTVSFCILSIEAPKVNGETSSTLNSTSYPWRSLLERSVGRSGNKQRDYSFVATVRSTKPLTVSMERKRSRLFVIPRCSSLRNLNASRLRKKRSHLGLLLFPIRKVIEERPWQINRIYCGIQRRTDYIYV